jgi:hypothetical protein
VNLGLPWEPRSVERRHSCSMELLFQKQNILFNLHRIHEYIKSRKTLDNSRLKYRKYLSINMSHTRMIKWFRLFPKLSAAFRLELKGRCTGPHRSNLLILRIQSYSLTTPHLLHVNTNSKATYMLDTKLCMFSRPRPPRSQ